MFRTQLPTCLIRRQFAVSFLAVLAALSLSTGCGDEVDVTGQTPTDASGATGGDTGTLADGFSKDTVAQKDVGASETAATDGAVSADSPDAALPDVPMPDLTVTDADPPGDTALVDSEVASQDLSGQSDGPDGTGTASETLCNPCAASVECGKDSGCVSYGPSQGSFCAIACKADGDCASGYQCVETADEVATKALRCVKAPDKVGDSVPGTCPCNDKAVASAMATACENTNASGTCKGVRTCSAAGLSACSAATPAADTCNGVDDNCNGQIDEQTCADSNPCTADTCEPAAGGCQNKPGSGSCDDGNACTLDDACKAGGCAGGPVNACDDKNPCTADACDPASGCTATAKEDASPCDADSDMCTKEDACKAGACTAGTPVDCSDGLPCTADNCDKVKGTCDHPNLGNGSECSDGSLCTSGDTCTEGICGGKTISCNDNNSCTVDSCELPGGCTATAVDGGACEDGDLCTSGDTCAGAKCSGGTAKDCLSTDPCMAGACSPQDGTCGTVAKPAGAGCVDGSACTSDDVCGDAGCAGKAIDCDDSNPCTSDACDATAGCQHGSASAPCNDGNACTDFDGCSEGKCAGTAKDVTVACNDGTVCTDDDCDPKTGCSHTSNDKACEDGSACTDGDLCKNGGCASGKNACVCQSDADCSGLEDGNLCNGTLICDKVTVPFTCKVDPKTVVTCGPSTIACQENACSAVTGKCAPVAAGDGNPCDADDNVCTAGDKCAGGKCLVGETLGCNDNNPCTDDKCDPKGGCVHTANTATCEDGNKCSTADACANKVCTPGKPTICDDKSPCTADICLGATGVCEFTPVSGTCSDGNPCTDGDSCANGKCGAGPTKACDDNNVCTADSCDMATGLCASLPAAGTCTDGDVCTSNDSCANGKCTPGKPLICDDTNPCTDDACDSKAGKCIAINNNLVCNDGTLCTIGDLCANGKCAGAPMQCFDANPCTADGCDGKAGKCTFTNQDDIPCDDGNSCSVGDLCKGGTCVAGTQTCPCTAANVAVVCNDSNPCTADTCLNAACGHKVNVGAGCDDGSLCTVGGTCSAAGMCVPKIVGCSDANPCTADSCDAVTGKCTNSAVNAGGCDDGQACTTPDACAAGKCVGKAKSCDDSNACTSETCTAASGICAYLNLTSTCTDGNPCTLQDTCTNGACVPKTSVVCNDNNACTQDKCNPAAGTCVFQNITAPCNDTNACTAGDSCVLGKCVGKPAVSCDDNNVCTNDACDPATGKCTFANNILVCNDNSLCTTGDVCAAGKCAGKLTVVCADKLVCTTDSCEAATGKCLFTPNTLPCDDGNKCSIGDVCADTKCAGKPTNCNDNNACTNDACNAADGKCVNAANILPCDDGSVCTQGELCSNGKCTPKTTTDCGDNSACTDDKCDPVSGKCLFLFNISTCDDGNKCTTGDVCSGGKCAGKLGSCACTKVSDCNDSNACTTDACTSLPGGAQCAFSVTSGGLCTDNNFCTASDTCVSGTCAGKPVNCNDNNVCTDDVCLPKTGCTLSPNTGKCDDKNLCTISDVCISGKCSALTLVACDDKNPCTNDACDPATGACKVTNNAVPCSDGNLCTLADACAAGKCVPGSAVTCDDANPCTADACDTVTGLCGHKATAALCNDGNACTANDTCLATKCVGSGAVNCDDGNLCTTDACAAKTGCGHVANSAACSDGNACTVGDVCKAAACASGVAKPCSDGKLCTDDKCDSATGVCSNPNNTVPCKDLSACTANDACSGGTCVGGQATSCDDKNPCTTDLCLANTGVCLYANAAGPCEDGNLCTVGDACATGKCASGSPIACNDNNPCTNDACATTTGKCSFVPASGAACTDGNNCTLGDVCTAGTCAGPKVVPCDDANVCTTDTCTTAGVCQHANNTLVCDDGNACTVGESCLGAKCQGGGAKNCNDTCNCTIDACLAKTGCSHTLTTVANTQCVSISGALITCQAATFQQQCKGCANGACTVCQ